MFNYDKFDGEPTNEQKWEQIRLWRNYELVQTDWTQVADAPIDKDAWAKYRQALRDLPAQGGDADKAVIPARP